MPPAVRLKVPALLMPMHPASSGGDMLLRMEKLFAGNVWMLQYAQRGLVQFFNRVGGKGNIKTELKKTLNSFG